MYPSLSGAQNDPPSPMSRHLSELLLTPVVGPGEPRHEMMTRESKVAVFDGRQVDVETQDLASEPWLVCARLFESP